MNLPPRVSFWLYVVLVSAVILFYGLWQKEAAITEAYRNAYECDRMLSKLDRRFRDVSPVISSHPITTICGTVRSKADLDELKIAFESQVVPQPGTKIGFQVRIEDSPTSKP